MKTKIISSLSLLFNQIAAENKAVYRPRYTEYLQSTNVRQDGARLVKTGLRKNTEYISKTKHVPVIQQIRKIHKKLLNHAK